MELEDNELNQLSDSLKKKSLKTQKHFIINMKA
jgi:hypothetical protein